jgi:hypothetical protein
VQGPAIEMEWVLLKFDMIRFRFLARVEWDSMGFGVIRINKMLLYICGIEWYKMRLVCLIRIEMICSIV